MNGIDLIQIATLGFFTGFGSTVGTEIGKLIVKKLRKENATVPLSFQR